MNDFLPTLASLAQQVYDEWTDDGRGRCIQIAERWIEFFQSQGLVADYVGLEDEHTSVFVVYRDEKFNLDLPAGYYEYIRAGRWVKFPNVVIDPTWISIN